METRPSEGVLAWLREAMARQGITTAELARLAGERRAVVRRVLAGREPLTVDQFVGWVQALGLQQDLASQFRAAAEPPPHAPSGEDATTPAEGEPAADRRLGVVEVSDPEEPEDWADLPAGVVGRPFEVDPHDVHARQAARLAFATGMDFSMLLDTGQLADSGIPEDVLRRFPEQITIRLDAAFHRHNQPVLGPDALELIPSSAAIYTCRIPWSAVRHVILDPVPPPPPEREEEEEPESPGPGPGLRLVKG